MDARNLFTKNKPLALIVLVVIFVIIVWFLAQAFRGEIILAQSLGLGVVHLRYYGIVLALAAAASYWLAMKRLVFFGASRQQAENLLIIVLLSGLIGARLYHVFSEIGFYWIHPELIFAIWNGGLGIFGAVLGGVIGLEIGRRLLRIPTNILRLLDWLAPSVVLGQIIGRLGNLFNYEAYGYATNLPWKMFVPEQFRLNGVETSAFFHPLFLYEMVFNALVLAILWRIGKKISPAGALFFAYLLLYNIGRFFLELLRVDSVFVGSWRLNSVTSLVLTIISAAALAIIYARKVPPIN
jgi:phosphatidylglycerol---prolipoprotein diacylglyceryl transferase